MTHFKLIAAFSLIAIAACGGSDASPRVSVSRVALVSTVPNPGGGLDRWADLHFTFSAPVSWAETQFVRCTSGCRTPLVPYHFVSTGTEVVGTPILPPEFGASYTVRVTPLFAQAAANGDLGANIDFAWSTLPPVTTVSSDVTVDTTLTTAGSPYYFAPGVHVAAALTIPAGVEVAGDLVATGTGSVTAIGTAASHIRISNAVFAAPGRLSYVDMLGALSVSAQDVDHADVGGVVPANEIAVVLRISGSLADSRLTDIAAPSLHGPIARNVFLRCALELGGSAPGNAFGISRDSVTPPPAAWDASTSFVNNHVSAGEAWLTPSAGTISGNTFAAAEFTTLWHVYPENYTTPVNLSGNYWSGADAAATHFDVPYRVYLDRSQPMLGLAPAPPVPTLAPMLAAADPATPTP